MLTSFSQWDAREPRKVRDRNQIKPEVRGVIAHLIRATCQSRGRWPLVLTGPAGVGKSCAALALLDYAATDGRAVFPGWKPAYVLVGDWVQAVTKSRMGEYEPPGCRLPIAEHELWDWLSHKSIICFDELGMRSNVSDVANEITKKTLDVREGLPLIVTSNLSLGQLSTLYDDRIASRLAAGTVVNMTGDDMRLGDKLNLAGAKA